MVFKVVRLDHFLLGGDCMETPFKSQIIAYENILPSEITQFAYLTNATSINRIMYDRQSLRVDLAAWAMIQIERSNRTYLILKDLNGRLFRLYNPEIIMDFYERQLKREELGARVISLEFYKEEFEPLSCVFIVQVIGEEI